MKGVKLLVVDDAIQICTGISEGIEWKKYGIDEVLVAYDGLTGLDIVKEKEPEIVISDIRMGGLDGLELSQTILQTAPLTRIILLSAYSDFEYARKGLEIGVFAYELKPLCISKIISCVQNAVCAWNKLMKIDKAASEYESFRKANILKEILEDHSENGSADIVSFCNIYDLKIDESYVCVLLHNQSVLLEEDVCEQLLQSYHGAFCRVSAEESLILLECSGSRLYQEYLHVEVKRFIRDQAPENTVGGGSSGSGLVHLAKMYQEAKQAIAHCFYFGSGSYVRWTNGLAFSEEPIAVPHVPKLPSGICALSDQNEMETWISDIYSRFISDETKHTPQCIHAFSIGLLNEIQQSFTQILGESNEQLSAATHKMSVSAPYRYLRDYQAAVQNAYRELYEQCFAVGDNSLDHFALRCRFYIGNHYQNDISVQDMADYFGITPNYFSHIFKKTMGVSFSWYLNMIKIKQANHLLQQGTYSTTDVAKAVGFSNYKYFHRVYRKYMNCAPTQHSEDNEDHQND